MRALPLLAGACVAVVVGFGIAGLSTIMRDEPVIIAPREPPQSNSIAASPTEPGAPAASAPGTDPASSAAKTDVAQSANSSSAAGAVTEGASPKLNSSAEVNPQSCPGNPNALGVSRTVEVDTTGGPGFGFEHFKSHDFLREGEVVLTFDDGPWPRNTPKVLAALAQHCVKATFFPIGEHATWHPEILRQVAAAGHSVGSHTWSHRDLSKKTSDAAKMEIEKGISAIHWALQGAPMAPFFRFPDLKHSPAMVAYLGERNIAIFSTDINSGDFRTRKPDQVIKSVLGQLSKRRKGILLLHDFQRSTAEGIATLLDQLKLNGYKVVHMVAKAALEPLPEYDEVFSRDQTLHTVSHRPTSKVVQTVH